jgi:hypothetical protein
LSNRSSLIPQLLRSGEAEAAADEAGTALGEMFGLDVSGVVFTQDEYSLNSVSGRARLKDGTTYFFKFHQEEGEQEKVGEYYRARLLSEAGLPVEVPVATSTRPGAQMVLYHVHDEPRMADVCAYLERSAGAAATLAPPLLAARHALDARIGEVAVRTLAPSTPTSASAAIHQLFHNRLADPQGRFPGGRYARYYLPSPLFAEVATKRWELNGVEYQSSLAELAEAASRLLAPGALARWPVVTAHGDDHQGNIWALEAANGPELVLFDPAFAASDMPALLAPVKATFHNALAHPFWLYHPDEAARRSTIEVTEGDGTVEVREDATMSRLRHQVLDSVAHHVWAPMLRQLHASSMLPPNWRAIVRAALFCCPMLVTNLVDEARPVPVRYLALARAVAAGSEPVEGNDVVSSFLDRVAP